MDLLQVIELTKNYGNESAVRGLTFELEQGKCVALLGPNGAGKTTTLRMLARLLQPTSGQISFGEHGGISDYRMLLGYLPQQPMFYGWMTGYEYMYLVAGLSGMGVKQAQNRSEDALERVGLQNAASKRISGYSGGMKQRLGLAQALIHEPKLLLLDEPVSALDPIGRREVIELVRQLRSETTVLFSTHVLHDAEEICDDILVMANGRLVKQGTLASLREEYRDPLVIVQVEREPSALLWLNSLKTKPYILEADIKGDIAKLWVQELQTARDELMKDATDHKIPLVKFEVGSSSLEDMFVKVVNER
ncbi:ABC transporter ATP-binding protein [Paenibacillus crassostreae]|uniref:ABC transporter ATP-binding protein n=1 Tax=Paenibacillus crassostreae TaxID=1763538 RepID=A0A167EST6_9BACL|nr:ABC transporter ATP-binding protein [Paenibacillus crassostreae]AOZ93497.1 ABC transporter ATP-binding protein [Paenibacillus crassostreae]OAB75848.1 ABC transporter ATP-binding protein [Paenibacillus crassostreae]